MKTVDDILEAVKSKLGSDIAFLTSDGSPSDVDKFISTGSTLLDYCISNKKDGGVPVGKITSISGMPSTGKTLLAMQICANAQKEGGLAIYIDSENALNIDFAKRVGLDIKNNFMHIRPTSLENVFEIMQIVFNCLHEKEKRKESQYPFAVMVWDSVAASMPKKELDKEDPGVPQMGIKAALLSSLVPHLINQLGRRRVAQVFLNQIRTDLAKAQMGGFGSLDTEPGGNAIPFYSSVRVKLKYKGKIKARDEVVGVKTKAEVVKTRFGPAFRECDFNVYFTKGVDDKESVVQYLSKRKKVTSRNGGRKGLLYKIGDSEYDIKEYKQKMAKDKEFVNYVYGLLEECMTKDLNPDEEDLKVDET